MSIPNQAQTNADQTQRDAPSGSQERRGWILALGLLVISFVWRMGYLGYRPFNYDEGHWLMFGVLADAGFKPYTETFVGIPPTALLTIQAGVALFETGWNVRLPMMLYSLVGVMSIFCLVKQQAEHHAFLAAGLAAIFLSFGPAYFPDSISVMAEVPAVAMALLSLALAQQYGSSRKYTWLILAGIAFALSLTLKVFVVFLPAISGVQLWLLAFADSKSWLSGAAYLKLAKMALAWAAGVALTFGLFFVLYDAALMYQQVVQFRLLLRELPLFSSEHIQDFVDILDDEDSRYLPLLLLSLLPFVLTWPRQWLRFWPWLTWFVLAFLFLFTHDPLRDRHLVLLLPPLAALSALGLGSLLPLIYQNLKDQIGKAKAVTAGALLVWMLFTPLENIDDFEREGFQLERRPDLAAVTTFIERLTSPDDYLIVDDQRFAIYTRRLVPPFLSETSLARIRIGWITPADILREAARYHVPFLMITTYRFNLIPDIAEAVDDRYAVRLLFRDEEADETMTVYAIETNTDQKPDYPLQASLDGQVWLKGVDLAPAPWHVGQEIAISTYWQAQTKIDQDYKIFIHLLNAQGELVGQFDHYPFQIEPAPNLLDIKLNDQYQQIRPLEELTTYPNAGLVPTRIWPVGQTLRETLTLPLPETVAAGTYSILIGLYHEASGERLKVDGGSDGQTAVRLERIEVKGD